MKKVIVLHDFDGKPYFKALEQVADVVYLNTRPFRFMLRDLLKYRKIQRETLNSLLFLFKLPFVRQQTILLGMAPFNIRLLIYSFLDVSMRWRLNADALVNGVSGSFCARMRRT